MIDRTKPYIVVSLWGKSEAGDGRHAQEIMRDLGISYGTSHPDSLGDCWLFGDLDGVVSDDLPSYVTVHLPTGDQ